MSEIERLREALEYYGCHTEECAWNAGNREHRIACDCGLDAALASTPPGAERGEAFK